MQKEMNLQIFQNNLLMAIDEIKEKGENIQSERNCDNACISLTISTNLD